MIQEIMAKSRKEKESDEQCSIYTKIPKAIDLLLEEMAEERRWSKAGTVSFILEEYFRAAGKLKN